MLAIAVVAMPYLTSNVGSSSRYSVVDLGKAGGMVL